jgi:hypothetical protein
MWTSEAIGFLKLAEYPRSFEAFTFLRQRECDLLATIYTHPYELFAELIGITRLETVDNLVAATRDFAHKLERHGFTIQRALILATVVLNKLDTCGFHARGIVTLDGDLLVSDREASEEE